MTRDEIEDRILEIQDDMLFGYKLLEQKGISQEELDVQIKECETEIKKLEKLKRKNK